MIKILRRIITVIWIGVVIYFGFWISQHQEFLDEKNLLNFFQSFGSAAFIVYILASFIRGLVLLPSLPLVLVGLLFFPDNLNLVFFISMLGIIFSAILIYRFSDLMGFDEIFMKHLENKKIQSTIEKYGFYAVFFWSFAPVVPTDVICYVAGAVRMNFWKFIAALAFGEGLIVALVVYGGQHILSIFRF